MEVMYNTSEPRTIFCHTLEGLSEILESGFQGTLVIKTPADVEVLLPWLPFYDEIGMSVVAAGNSRVVVSWESQIRAIENSTVICKGSAVCDCYDNSVVILKDHSRALSNSPKVRVFSANNMLKESHKGYTVYQSLIGEVIPANL